MKVILECLVTRECCSACSRCYVQESVYDELVRKSVQKLAGCKLVDLFRSDCDQGPQVDKSNLIVCCLTLQVVRRREPNWSVVESNMGPRASI